MGNLNFLGIGPRIAVVLLPWLTVTIILSSTTRLFYYTQGGSIYLRVCGIILMIVGLAIYISTVKLLLSGLKQTRLITTGAYALCQNPLYSSIILFIIPALSLLLNSWLIISSGIIGYVQFKLFIRKEYDELERFFGEDYIRYKNETPEFFPLPLKKWYP